MKTPDTPTSASAHPRKKPRSLVQDIVNNISESIRSAAIRPGDKLPTEAEIMRRHNVSRTVVREAISRLHAAGLVETQHGIGTFVLEPANGVGFGVDPATIVTLLDVLAILELRISLETESAALAAMRRTDEQLSEMRRAMDAFQSSVEHGADSITSDFQFHIQVAFATGNRYFVDTINHLGTAVIPRTRINTAQLARADAIQYLNRIKREHEEIYDAIARRDPETARAAMRAHLGQSRERLRRVQEQMESRKS